jgi:arylsulfatase A-like enzyme
MSNYLRNFMIVVVIWCIETNRAEAQQSPNVIFILADDLGYGDTQPYGQKKIRTPNIDQLARSGMKFTQFYAGSTVCAPSRSSLMTGQHTGHTTVRGNLATASLNKDDVTIAEIMKTKGYTTGLVGKWGLGTTGSPGTPLKKGFDYFYGYLDQVHAHNHYPSFLWENETKDHLPNKVTLVPGANKIAGVATERKVYAQDKLIEKAMTFIEREKANKFFLYLALTLPHANNEAKQFDRSGMEIADAGAYTGEHWPTPQKEHAAMITYLDKCVGQIITQLDQAGIRNNTLIIFTSDNGPHDEGGADHRFFDSNGPLRGLKRDMFEGGIRVPFIAAWPDHIKPGSTSNEPLAFWDVMPTLAELTGAKSPTTDGISFLPALLGKGEQQKHGFLYWEFYEQKGKQAIRMGDWKFIKLNVHQPGEEIKMLFDLASDIAEEHNLADQHPEVVAQCEALITNNHRYSESFHFEWEN